MLIKGTDLSLRLQNQAKARFVHRYTGDHKPGWVDRNPTSKLHFASDADWLANTYFPITKQGEFDERTHHCESNPTWPEGK